MSDVIVLLGAGSIGQAIVRRVGAGRHVVVGGFTYSDNTCPVCRKGAHANCLNGGGYDGCQAEKIRSPRPTARCWRPPASRTTTSCPTCSPSRT